MAAALVAASVLVRIALAPWIGSIAPFLQFFPAILVASWYGGWGPGVLATGLSAVAALVFLSASSAPAVAAPLVATGLFVATGLGIAWLNHRLRAAEGAQRTAAALATARAERLDAIINTTVDGIIVISADGTIEAFNRGAERLFGYAESDMVGRNVSMLMPPPHHEHHDEYLRRYLATGEARIIGIGREVSGRRRDGSVFPLHLSVGEMTIAGERKFTGMLHDLSARVQLETQLRASEARWRAIIDSAVDGIVLIDERGRIEAFNPGAERLFGYAEPEVVGRNVTVLMPSPYREDHDRYLSRYLATGDARIIGSGREVQGRRQDGTTFPLHLSVGEIQIHGERKFTGILHDLSTRVEMEQELRERAALAKLGEMAAVIAHEVKNPLAAIRGAVQVFRQQLAADAPQTHIVREIIARIDSLNRLMGDLLLFARPPRPRPAPIDLLPLLTATATLLGRDPALRSVDIRVEGSAPPVRADAEMLKIVFHNLFINAAHAMRGRGTLRIAITADEAACQIAVTDSGPGIPPEIRARLFTPFFTTKARGSGLGLSTAKRLIEAHHGDITIDCPPSGGTTVLVQLPVGAS